MGCSKRMLPWRTKRSEVVATDEWRAQFLTPSRSTRYSLFFRLNSVMQMSALHCIIIGECQRQKSKLQSVTMARPSSEDRQKRHLGVPVHVHQMPHISRTTSVAFMPRDCSSSFDHLYTQQRACRPVCSKNGSHNPARKLISRSSSRQFPAHRREPSLSRCFLNLSGVKSRYLSVEPNPT